MILRLAAILTALALPVLAQDLPAHFSVTGVAANDVLNIRAEPSANATKVGEIAPYAISVEVLEVSADGAWGRVSTGEGDGWVALRFLEPQPPADPSLVPRPLTCLGTEPFWALSLLPQGAEWMTPDTRADLTETEEPVASAGYHVRLEEGPTRVFHLTVTRQECSDGMSDRRFGMSARLFVESPDDNALLSGCCTFDHR